MILCCLFLPFLLWSQEGLDYLAEYMDYMNAPPLGIFSTGEERILLLYPRGYVDLAPGLKTDAGTLLSLWYSEAEDWPAIKQGQVGGDSLYLVDQEGGLHRLNLSSGAWENLPSPGQSSQRLLFLSADRLALFHQNFWQYYRLSEGWQEEAGPPGLSPLTLGLGSADRLYLMDPLSGRLIDPEGNILIMDPPPGSGVIKGQLFRETLHLWSSFEHLEYSLEGKVLGRESNQSGMQNLLWITGDGLLRYHQAEEALFLNEIPFSYGEADWVSFLKNEVPPLLEREDRDFMVWALNLVEQTYLRNPLDSELGQIKKQLEILLQRDRTNP